MKNLITLSVLVLLLTTVSCKKNEEACYKFTTVTTISLNTGCSVAGYPQNFSNNWLSCGIDQNEAKLISADNSSTTDDKIMLNSSCGSKTFTRTTKVVTTAVKK